MGFAQRLTGIAAILLAAQTLAATEVAVLRTGFRLRADRHEAQGGGTRIYLNGGGWVDVNPSDIDRFELEEARPSTPPSRPEEPAQPTDIVLASAARHGLDPDLIRSVIRAESGGNPRAVSPKGAVGLMQLMPGTARGLNVGDAYDPAQNVEGGTSYLRQLLARFDNDLALALAAYNAGPEKVESYKGIPPYTETRAYVSRVIRWFNQSKTAEAAPKPAQ